jgi:hypothetical protein
MVIPVVDTEEPREPCQWADMLKEETHPKSRIRPDRVNVAKWVDKPEQNYNEWISGDWSKLLRLEPAVVAEHRTRTRASETAVSYLSFRLREGKYSRFPVVSEMCAHFRHYQISYNTRFHKPSRFGL